jgi:hypothetical protein
MSVPPRRPTALVEALRLAVAESQRPWRVEEGESDQLYEIAFVVARDKAILYEIDVRDPALLAFLVPSTDSIEGAGLNAHFGFGGRIPGRDLGSPQRLAEHVRVYFPALEMESMLDRPAGAPPMSERYDPPSVVWRNVPPKRGRGRDAASARPEARGCGGLLSRALRLLRRKMGR